MTSANMRMGRVGTRLGGLVVAALAAGALVAPVAGAEPACYMPNPPASCYGGGGGNQGGGQGAGGRGAQQGGGNPGAGQPGPRSPFG